MFAGIVHWSYLPEPTRVRPAFRPITVLFLGWCLLGVLGARGAGPGDAAAIGAATSLVLQDLAGAPVHPLTNDGRKATVLFFVMHECPVANSFAPEISRILGEYTDRGVRGHVVYVESDLTPAQAREHARDYGFKSALLDPEHRLVRATGATVSPEAAVLTASGALFYRGRIDDRVADFGKRRVQPTRRDLRLALDAVLIGKPAPTPRTKAVGCYIPDDPPPQSKPPTSPRPSR